MVEDHEITNIIDFLKDQAQPDFNAELSRLSYTDADGQAVATITDDDVDVYLIDWKYRMKITFDGYDRAEIMTNFPALAILNEEIEHEAWFAEFLAHGPSGHFRRRTVGESPFVSKFLHP